MEDNGKKVEERVASSFLFFSFFYAEIHATRELINQENPGKPPLVGLSDWCIIKIAHIINRNTWHTELKIIMASRFANSLVVDQFQSLTIIELNFWIVLKVQNCTHLVTVCMCSDTRCIVDGSLIRLGTDWNRCWPNLLIPLLLRAAPSWVWFSAQLSFSLYFKQMPVIFQAKFHE